MLLVAVTDSGGVGFGEQPFRLGAVDQAHSAAHRQRLDDMHHIFMVHFDAGEADNALCSMAVPERPLETTKKAWRLTAMASCR